MKPDLYIRAIIKTKSLIEEYHELNRQIKHVQGDDFYCHMSPINNDLLESYLDAIDDALLSIAGISEIASYYVYEELDTYRMKTHEREYAWSNGEEFSKAVYEMIKDNNQAKP